MNMEEVLPTKLPEALKQNWSDYIVRISGCGDATQLAHRLAADETKQKSVRVQCSRFMNGDGREIAYWLKPNELGLALEELTGRTSSEMANWLISRLPSHSVSLIHYLRPSLQPSTGAPEFIEQLIERVQNDTKEEIVLWPEWPNDNLDPLLEKSLTNRRVRIVHDRTNRPYGESAPNIPVRVVLTHRDLEEWLKRLAEMDLLGVDLDQALASLSTIGETDLSHLARAPGDIFETALVAFLNGNTSALLHRSVDSRTLVSWKERFLEESNVSIWAFLQANLIPFLEKWFATVGDLHRSCSAAQLDECLGETEQYEPEQLLNDSLSALLRDDASDRKAAAGRILASMHRNLRKDLVNGGLLVATPDGQFQLSRDLIRLAELELKLELSPNQVAILPDLEFPPMGQEEPWVFTDYRDIIVGAVLQSQVALEDWVRTAIQERRLRYAHAIFLGLTLRDPAAFSEDLNSQIVRLWASLAWVFATRPEPNAWVDVSLGEAFSQFFPDITGAKSLEKLADKNFIEMHAEKSAPTTAALRAVIPLHCPFNFSTKEFADQGHKLPILLHRLREQDGGAQEFLMKNPKYIDTLNLTDLELLEVFAQISEEHWGVAEVESIEWLLHYCEKASAEVSDQTLAALYKRAPKAFAWLEPLTTKDFHSLLEFLASESFRHGLAVQILRAAGDHSTLKWIIETVEDPSHSSVFQHRFDLTQQEEIMVSVAQLRHAALLALAHLGRTEFLAQRTTNWKSEWPQTLMVARYVVEHLTTYANNDGEDVLKREIIALYLHTFLPNPEIAGTIPIQELDENNFWKLAYEITQAEKNEAIRWVRSKAPTIFAKAQPFANQWHEDPSLSAERTLVGHQ